jgi:hypothetical protein
MTSITWSDFVLSKVDLLQLFSKCRCLLTCCSDFARLGFDEGVASSDRRGEMFEAGGTKPEGVSASVIRSNAQT